MAGELQPLLDKSAADQNLPGPYVQIAGSDGLTYFVHASNADKDAVVRELVRMQADARVIQRKLLTTPYGRQLGLELAPLAPSRGASRIVGCSPDCAGAQGWQIGQGNGLLIFVKIGREPEGWPNMYRWYFMHELTHAAIGCGGCPHNLKYWDGNKQIIEVAYKALPPAPARSYPFNAPLSFDQHAVVKDGKYPNFDDPGSYGAWNPADPVQWPRIQAALRKFKDHPNFK